MLLSLQFDKKCLLSQYFELKRPFKSAYDEAATAQDGLKQILYEPLRMEKTTNSQQRKKKGETSICLVLLSTTNVAPL